MSISQHRVISLINAGTDYRQAFERLVRLIDEQRNGAHTPAQIKIALEIIYRSAGDTLLTQPAQSKSALEIEYKHFKANWKRNERNRYKAEVKRRDAGIPAKPKLDTPFLHLPLAPPSYTQHAQQSQPRFQSAPFIDLSHDPDDPENNFGTGGIASPGQALPLIPGETDADRAARRAMVEDALRDFGPKAEPIDYSKLPQVISEKDEKNED